ncbi:PEP-CTERM sorting domain-containing protein [Candidatus Omnitrophota bacterium]
MIRKFLVFCGVVILSVFGCFISESQAVVVDLTGSNVWQEISTTSYGSAYFSGPTLGNSSVGTFDPFVIIQANGTQKGYNTLPANREFDTQPQTENLLISTIPIVAGSGTGTGGNYREFLIGANQNGSSLISLDRVVIYASDTADLTGYPFTANGWPADPIFDLGTGNYALFNADNTSGGGLGIDGIMYIPDNGFTTQYVYVYSEWGSYPSQPGFDKQGRPISISYESNDGAESIGVRVGSVPGIPEPATLSLLGLGLLGLVGFRRKRS